MSRHEMPKQLENKHYILKNLKKYSPKIEKCWTQKIRAFHIHSIMSRHEMPKQLENKRFQISQKIWKNTEFQDRKMLDQKEN